MTSTTHRRGPAPRSLAAALGVAALTTIGVVAAGHASAAGQPAAQTITIIGHPGGGGFVDNAPKGQSLGDAYYESGTLTDTAGHRRGRFLLTGQLVDGTVKHGSEQVTQTVLLADGQIVATGGHGTVARFTLPVVGGTGAYAGASGTLRISPGPHGTERGVLTLEPRS